MQQTQTLTTLGDFLKFAEQQFLANNIFFGHGTDNAWDEAVAIATYVLGLPQDVQRDVLPLELTVAEQGKMLALVEQRIIEQIPLAYLTKQAWFNGEKYYVDKRVIIPRSPFAELIRNKFSPFLATIAVGTVLDLCTGSGCIGISAAKAFPDSTVDLVDISSEALEVAKINIDLHKLTARVLPIKSDLFANLATKQYDLIISNPPYVSPIEHADLPCEYKHEPTLAFISGNDGFTSAKEILQQAYNFLNPNGLLFVEVGSHWREFAKLYPKLKFKWIKFNQGGEGVFMLRKDQLC